MILNNYLIITGILCSTINSPSATSDTLKYKTITGKDTTSTVFTISQIENGKEVLAEYNLKGIKYFSGVTMTDSFMTRNWTYKSSQNKTDLAASFYNDTVILKGRYKNKKVDKIFPLNAKHWKQMFPLDLKEFVISDSSSTLFCGVSTISIATMQMGTLEAKKIGLEHMTINGKDMELLHVRVTVAGFKSIFWHGDYWYKQPSGTFVMSVSYDFPGKPPVISILTN